MDDPKLKKMRRPQATKGYDHKTGLIRGKEGFGPCPCGGKAQEVSPRLAARRADYDANYTSVSGFHRPGSQNRKK